MSNNCDLDIDDGKGLEGIEIIYRINSTQWLIRGIGYERSKCQEWLQGFRHATGYEVMPFTKIEIITRRTSLDARSQYHEFNFRYIK